MFSIRTSALSKRVTFKNHIVQLLPKQIFLFATSQNDDSLALLNTVCPVKVTHRLIMYLLSILGNKVWENGRRNLDTVLMFYRI